MYSPFYFKWSDRSQPLKSTRSSGFVLGNQRFVEKVAGFGADREQHGVDSVQVKPMKMWIGPV
jgi:hypothetical protein